MYYIVIISMSYMYLKVGKTFKYISLIDVITICSFNKSRILSFMQFNVYISDRHVVCTLRTRLSHMLHNHDIQMKLNILYICFTLHFASKNLSGRSIWTVSVASILGRCLSVEDQQQFVLKQTRGVRKLAVQRKQGVMDLFTRIRGLYLYLASDCG